MPSRIEIRHAVIDAIKTVAGIEVRYEQHITDLGKVMPAAVVYFTQVEVEEDLKGNRRYTGTLAVSLFVSGVDDDIDPLIDQVVAATDLAITAPNPMGSAWTFDRLEYDHEIQPGTVAATMQFRVWFTD